MSRRIALFGALIGVACLSYSQETPTAPSPGIVGEAPETLLEFEVGDAEVNLFASGNWLTGIGGSLGAAVTWDAAGSVWQFPYSVPGLDAVPFFNRVDMTLSLWLLNRYFVETSVSDELQISQLLFGYQGAKDEFVQTVLIGNTAIDMTEYPYLGFGDSLGSIGRDVPGAVAVFETPISDHEIMVRFESSSESELIYANGGIVDQAIVPASAYLRHRLFVLPDNNLTQIAIYEEDGSGAYSGDDGRAYRLVDLAAETEFSLADGTIRFDQPPSGRIVAYYTIGASTIGDATLGLNSFYLLNNGSPDESQPASLNFDIHPALDGDLIDFLTTVSTTSYTVTQPEAIVTVGTDRCLVVFDPGRYSPLESAALYSTPQGFGGREVQFKLARRDGTPVASPVAIGQTGNGFLLLGDSSDPRSFASRYPFADSGFVDPNDEIYGPVEQAAPGNDLSADYVIVAQRSTPADSIVLPANYVPGSVRVIRNGLAVDSFTVADDGKLTFSRPLQRTDTVRVLFRSSSGAESGDLILGTGNRIAVGDSITVEAAAGIRWKPISAEYTTVPGSHPGYLAASSSISYEGADDAIAQESLLSTLSASLDVGASYAIPDTTGVLLVAGMDGAGTLLSISPSRLLPAAVPADFPIPMVNRGRLLYVDYSTADFLGNEQLLAYNSVVDPANRYTYADGGRIGPYPALSLDTGAGDFTGTVMVMEYELDADDDWVGGALTIPGGTDLSGAQGVVFAYKSLDIVGAVDMRLQIGATDEDLDGDAILDAGSSAVSPYIIFNSEGMALRAGTIDPLRTPLSEDGDGDEVLDSELPDRIFTFPALIAPAIAVTSDTGWTYKTIPLNDDDRKLLTEARSARIVIAGTGVAASGRILISSIQVQGTEFSVRAPDTVAVSAFEIDGVLDVRWTESAADAFTLVRHTDAIAARDYGELRLSYRVESALTRTMTLRAMDGVAGTVVAETGTSLLATGWQLLTVALPDSDAAISRFEVEFSGTGNGRVLLDDLSLWDPRSRFGLVAEAHAAWRPPVTIDIGDVNIVREVLIEARVAARGESHADGLSAIATGVTAATEASAVILGADVGGSFAVTNGIGGAGMQGSHDLTLPFFERKLTIGETYRQSYGTLGEAHSHGVNLVASAAWGRGTLRWETTATELEARRTWSGAFDLHADTAPLSGAPGSGGVGFGAAMSLDASQRLEPTVTASAYPSAWLTSFQEVIPSTDAVETRSRVMGGSAAISVDSRNVGMEASLTGSVGNSRDTDLLEAGIEARVRVPFSITDTTRFAIHAGRTLSVSDSVVSSSFAGDLGPAANLITQQRLLFTGIPVWELIDPSFYSTFDADSRGLVSAIYTPDLTLEMSRSISSSAWSLLIPTIASVSFSRQAERLSDSVRGKTTIAARASFIAPNLFGRLGVARLFDFYDSDEFISAGQLAVSIDEGSGTSITDGQVELQQRFFWIDRARLETDATIHARFQSGPGISTLDGEARANADLVWESQASRLPVLSNLIADGGSLTLEHTETINVVGDFSAIGEPSYKWSLTLIGRHSTELLIPDIGSLRLYGGLGFGGGQGNSSGSFYFGAHIGIEGRLSL